MAQPTSAVLRTAREPEKKLQIMQPAHGQKPGVSLPRITTRESSVLTPLLETDKPGESSLVERAADDPGINPVRFANEAPAYTGAILEQFQPDLL